MIIKQAQQIIHETETGIELLNGSDISASERFKKAVALIDDGIQTLRLKVSSEGFISESEEITFFKELKPRLYALRLFESLFYQITINRPTTTEERIREYYEQELFVVNRELNSQPYHYLYFQLGAKDMDSVYFLRSGGGGDIPISHVIPDTPDFSTPADYIFARFIAYERVREFLLDVLQSSVFNTTKLPAGMKTTALQWTGESINLVELAYGIWLTGQLNHGQATITQIVQWLEKNLQVNIGTAFRRWSSISKRKRISITKFVDQMKSEILKRTDDENAIK